MFFVVVSPNIGLNGVLYTTNKQGFLYEITYEINDFLALIMFLRVYCVFRSLINLSRFHDARTYRVAKMMGSKMTRMFAIRSLVDKFPFVTLSVVLIIAVSLLAYSVKLIEGPAYYVIVNNTNTYGMDYNLYENCIWNIIITMTTVGYGDYVPFTNLGRLILTLSAVIGTVLVSIFIVTIQKEIDVNPLEANALRFYDRIKAKEEIEKKGASYFKSTFQFVIERNKCLRNIKSNENILFDVNNNSSQQFKHLQNSLTNRLYNRIKHKRLFKHEFQ